jgi:hypothetical protein
LVTRYRKAEHTRRGADGNYVGTVARVEGNRIKMARNHVKADGAHHWVPQDWVASVNGAVTLGCARDQARREWWPAPILSGYFSNVVKPT